MTSWSIMKPVAVLVLFISQFSLAASDRPIVAVFDMDGGASGISKRVLSELTNYLSVKLTEGGYEVLPRDQIKKRLRAQKKSSHKSCFDQTCQIELGRELAAQKSLSTRIMKIGRTCKVTATLYDLRKSTAELAASAGSSCGDEALLSAIEKIAVTLCEPLRAMQKVSEKAESEFDDLLKGAQQIKQRKQKIKKAWQAVSKMARDDQIPRETRGKLVSKFLDKFSTDNPYQEQAKSLLAEIIPGTLVVQSEPRGASVYVNGTEIGRTPIKKELKAGEYRIYAQKEGYDGSEKTAAIIPGKTVDLSFLLKDTRPGVINVVTKPEGAKAYVIGDNVAIDGRTPLSKNFQPGKYIVKVKLDGYKSVEKEAYVERTKETIIQLELEKLPRGKLVVKTETPGETISVEKTQSVRSLNTSVKQANYNQELFKQVPKTKEDLSNISTQWYKTWWFWTTVSLVAVVTGTGLVLGFALPENDGNINVSWPVK